MGFIVRGKVKGEKIDFIYKDRTYEGTIIDIRDDEITLEIDEYIEIKELKGISVSWSGE
jgi:hypothetical protein